MPVSRKRKKSADGPGPQTAAPTAVIHRSTYTTMAGIAIALALAGWLIFGDGRRDGTIQVIVPTLTAQAQKGEKTYNRVCMQCHGLNVAGSEKGPSLVETVYRPSHHADGAFRNAIIQGVRPHHWQFGPMPPQPQVRGDEISDLIFYIREVQQANGVF